MPRASSGANARGMADGPCMLRTECRLLLMRLSIKNKRAQNSQGMQPLRST